MLKFVFLLVTVAYALGAAVQPQLNGRIVGGNLTTISQFPWQVSVQSYNEHNCGGSIYNEYIIVTAAHCVGFSAIDEMKIRVGSSFWNAGGMLMDVVNYKRHDKYDYRNMQYDVAVIRLKSPLKFSSTIQPIPLASVEPRFGATALISGWGMTQFGANSISTVLQYIESIAINSTTCRHPSYGYNENQIHASMICAAAPGKDACQMDSGGPMVSDDVLVGVVSWGRGCAFEHYPGVYANVAALKDWIVEAAETV